MASALVLGSAATAQADGEWRRTARHQCPCQVSAAHHRHHNHIARRVRLRSARTTEFIEETFLAAPPVPIWPIPAGVAVPPSDSAYDRAMVTYLSSPELTGYVVRRPPAPIATLPPAVVTAPALAPSPVPAPVPGPIMLSFRPYRILVGNTVYEYDTTVGQYVALAARDATASVAVAMMAAAPPIVAPAP